MFVWDLLYIVVSKDLQNSYALTLRSRCLSCYLLTFNMTDAKQPIFFLTYIGLTIVYTVLQVSIFYFVNSVPETLMLSQLNQTFYFGVFSSLTCTLIV